jgi:hypothetical protein
VILKLEPNKPYTIALKYPTAKQVDGFSGPQLRWILSNGDILYTPLVVGAQIEDLGIKPGQPFTLTKRKNGDGTKWIAERPSSQGAATPAPHETNKTPIAALLDSAEPLDGIPAYKPITRLEDALRTAVAAAAAAEKYGREIGYAVRFAPADIKSLGISVYIGQQKGQYAA